MSDMLVTVERLEAERDRLKDALEGLMPVLVELGNEPECDAEVLRAIHVAREALAACQT